MRLLLRTALQNRRHYILIVFTVISMFAMTISSQMEMLALGLLTESSADFFSLFAPKKEGILVPEDRVTLQQVEARWDDIDSNHRGYISKKDANAYLARNGQHNLLANAIYYLEQHLHLTNRFALLVILLIVIAVFKAFALFGSKYFTQLVSIRVSRDLRQSYFEHIQKLPMTFYHQHNIGALSSRAVVDASAVASAINTALIHYLQTPFMLISTALLCFYISPVLSGIIFIGLPVIIFPIVRVAQKIKKVSRSIQRNQEGFTSVLIDFLSGIQTIKLFSMQKFALEKYKSQNDQMARLEERTNRYNCLIRPILHTLGGLFLAAVMLYGVYVLQMSISSLIVFAGLLFQFYEPIKKFSEENYQIQRGVVAAERMFEVLHHPEEAAQKDKSQALIEFDGQFNSLEFKDVWFRYDRDWVLKGLSFSVTKGQMLAIVGPTGSGKSTIAQLIPRLFDIERGQILLNGRPLHEYTLESLRRYISFVAQRPFIFLSSIEENIAVGLDVTHEHVEQAAKQAHAAEFIEQLPLKYETLLSESGKNLSGGQQQRVTIARALVKDAPLLIMDEATASLDALSERRIKETMLEQQGKITQIIIAHRFSTIENADQILFLDQGEKVAQGTLKELQISCPAFARMWDLMRLSE